MKWLTISLGSLCLFAAGSRMVPSAPRVQAPGDTPANPLTAPPAAAASAPASSGSSGYQSYAELTAALHGLVAGAPGVAELCSIATTADGRAVWALQVAAAGESAPDDRPALLVVGGIDADYPAGSETAFRVAQALVSAAQGQPDGDIANMLKRRTFYVFPRMNPDGIEAFFAPVRCENRRNATPIDEDRDGRTDEDPPNDLNGDGLIGVMRVPDPEGEWMVDPEEPRLLKRADRAKGERGVFKLLSEGIDDDGDGEINEDGPGGVGDDRNWPHFYEAGTPGVGMHQLSEPETRALAEFVVTHPRIAAAVVYGRNDNIVAVPKGTQRGPEGQSYRDLHPDDVEIYEFISEKYKETTGLKGSAGATAEGALYAWLYAQRGIPTFATSLWWPFDRDQEQATTAPATQPASQPSSPVASQPLDSSPSQPAEAAPAGPGSPSDDTSSAQESPPERTARLSGLRGRPGDRAPARQEMRRGRRFPGGPRVVGRAQPRRAGGPVEAGPSGGAPVSSGAAERALLGAAALVSRVESTDTFKRWLKYSDERRAGEGFLSWTQLDHPTLGSVEVGGLVPYFTTTPPPAELEAIADAQVHFLVALSGLLPAPRFADPQVRRLGADVWEVEVRLENPAYLPTHLAIARHIALPGLVLRPLIPKERRLGGPALQRVDYLAGNGGTVGLRWLIRGQADESVEFSLYSRTHGQFKTTVVLRQPAGKRE